MSLQDTLDAFKRNFEAGGPPYHVPYWVHEPMHRATHELIASGAAHRALKAGASVPDFKLRDADGAEVSSRDLLARGPLVLSFYRGVWCPYCNLELRALQAALPEIEKRGASLVAISPQTHSNSRRSARENNITFPIVSDPRNEVAAAFRLRFKLPDYLIALYRTVFKNDLAIVNADDNWTLPMPARFVIDQDGTIIYAEVNPDYTHRPDPRELLPALDKTLALAR
jgi:peroxiredoxin